MRTIPAGIDWRRTGRKTWVCTIRREPETVLEPSDYAQGLQNGLAMQNLGVGDIFGFGCCPCCGQAYQSGSASFGGGLGDFGLVNRFWGLA